MSFSLNRVERQSPVWLALHAHYTKRLAELRAQNDTMKPAEETAFLRGQISAVKVLLALNEDRPHVPEGRMP
jgi:hypothetical protein